MTYNLEWREYVADRALPSYCAAADGSHWNITRSLWLLSRRYQSLLANQSGAQNIKKLTWALFSSLKKFCKIFQILHHIKSLCMHRVLNIDESKN